MGVGGLSSTAARSLEFVRLALAVDDLSSVARRLSVSETALAAISSGCLVSGAIGAVFKFAGVFSVSVANDDAFSGFCGNCWSLEANEGEANDGEVNEGFS